MPEERALLAVLAAFAHDVHLFEGYALKGGTALHRFYHTPRASVDLDFSSRTRWASFETPLAHEAAEELLAAFRAQLDEALNVVRPAFGFAYLQVQTARVEPSKRPERSSPAFAVTVGYAATPRTAPVSTLVKLDVSLYETVCDVTIEEVDGAALQVSALDDIVAEKMRALLQQVTRRRNRPGDVYDLWFLTTRVRGLIHPRRVRRFLDVKCAGHEHLDPVTRPHFDHPQVRSRARQGFDKIQDRLPPGEPLPAFDTAFAAVLAFADRLGLPGGPPWGYETEAARSSSSPTG